MNDKNYSTSKIGDSFEKAVSELKLIWETSPFPSTKLTSYFAPYVQLFSCYRNTDCVFIETGTLGGGSLFMWREWLGPKARIIGVDLNPEAKKWIDYGFEIYIGDQGDPDFWRQTFEKIGQFDVLLDDGGHQSFQQIVTTIEAIKHANRRCVIAIEDTHTSFMSDFRSHGDKTFLNYAKASTDILTARGVGMYPTRFKNPENSEILENFKNIQNIQFFNSLVAFNVDPINSATPSVIWNKKDVSPSDFRYNGVGSAVTNWPDPFIHNIVTVNGENH
jgi:hypothetical protein